MRFGLITWTLVRIVEVLPRLFIMTPEPVFLLSIKTVIYSAIFAISVDDKAKVDSGCNITTDAPIMNDESA